MYNMGKFLLSLKILFKYLFITIIVTRELTFPTIISTKVQRALPLIQSKYNNKKFPINKLKLISGR